MREGETKELEQGIMLHKYEHNSDFSKTLDPHYELQAPTGFHFTQYGTHFINCFNMKEVKDMLKGESLTKCEADCDTCYEEEEN